MVNTSNHKLEYANYAKVNWIVNFNVLCSLLQHQLCKQLLVASVRALLSVRLILITFGSIEWLKN